MGFRNWVYEKTGFNLKTLKYTPQLDLGQFESIGDNCEFGLFLKKSKNYKSSFFRFVRILDYSKVNELIVNNFSDIFLFENLIPITEEMVFDKKYKMSFHTSLRSHKKQENFEFNLAGEQLLNAYNTELEKIKYLSIKFSHELKTANKIYVIKTNEFTSIDEINQLSKTLLSMGNCKILNVRATNESKKLFTIEKLNQNLFIGYIDEFADYNNVTKFRFYSWYRLMNNAKKIMVND